MEECSLCAFPFRCPSEMMFFYLVIRGWNFTSAYLRIQSINIRRHIERRHVNREEFREYNTRFSLSLGNEQADAGRDGRTRLARPNSQA